jgi:hypothetical protein
MLVEVAGDIWFRDPPDCFGNSPESKEQDQQQENNQEVLHFSI